MDVLFHFKKSKWNKSLTLCTLQSKGNRENVITICETFAIISVKCKIVRIVHVSIVANSLNAPVFHHAI